MVVDVRPSNPCPDRQSSRAARPIHRQCSRVGDRLGQRRGTQHAEKLPTGLAGLIARSLPVLQLMVGLNPTLFRCLGPSGLARWWLAWLHLVAY